MKFSFALKREITANLGMIYKCYAWDRRDNKKKLLNLFLRQLHAKVASLLFILTAYKLFKIPCILVMNIKRNF